jgi:hypothetical protein
MSAPSPLGDRRVTLFGKVYRWHTQQRPAPAGQLDGRLALRRETPAEHDAIADAVRVSCDAARAQAHRVARGDQPAALAATLAQIDTYEQAATP